MQEITHVEEGNNYEGSSSGGNPPPRLNFERQAEFITFGEIVLDAARIHRGENIDSATVQGGDVCAAVSSEKFTDREVRGDGGYP